MTNTIGSLSGRACVGAVSITVATAIIRQTFVDIATIADPIAAVAKLAGAGKATNVIVTVGIGVAVISAISALIDIRTTKAITAVARITCTIVITDRVCTGRCTIAIMTIVTAFVDVRTGGPITIVAAVTRTVRTASGIGTGGVAITTAVIGGAFVNIGTALT